MADKLLANPVIESYRVEVLMSAETGDCRRETGTQERQ